MAKRPNPPVGLKCRAARDASTAEKQALSTETREIYAALANRLGDLEHINPKVIEGLFAADLAFLQDLYRRLNENGHNQMAVSCPHCDKEYEIEVGGPGGL